MTIKNLTINTILTITFLISHSHAWNMEKPTSPHKNPCLAIIPYAKFDLKNLIKEYNAQYNINNSPLVTLAPEMLEKVLSKIGSLDHLKKLVQGYNAQYNLNNSPSIDLSPEMLKTVFSKISHLEDAMKTALALRKTCKYFYE